MQSDTLMSRQLFHISFSTRNGTSIKVPEVYKDRVGLITNSVDADKKADAASNNWR